MANCRSCGEPIEWAITAKGKRTPVNLDGEPHWATCGQANEWRRRNEIASPPPEGFDTEAAQARLRATIRPEE